MIIVFLKTFSLKIPLLTCTHLDPLCEEICRCSIHNSNCFMHEYAEINNMMPQMFDSNGFPMALGKHALITAFGECLPVPNCAFCRKTGPLY